MQRLLDRFRFSKVLLAMPSASRRRRREIVATLKPFPMQVLAVPGIADLVHGWKRVDELQEISIEDLLGREPVPPRAGMLQSDIVGKVVMVTGGGGSIGSELCRQAMRLGAERLVIFDVSEFALYAIEQELLELAAEGHSKTEIVPLLGSVLDAARVNVAIASTQVDTIFHAAAYKHVPLVESNTVVGVQNNVAGTKHVCEAAIAHGVSKFVLVSTDKAVRPTNAMGASKRLAEMLVQAIAASTDITRFGIVRFGNVLSSSGSVIPKFQEQVRSGGPVTVTHPEIERYFMTIQEAAELVIQAGSISKDGEIFVLDMGDRVRILDLAHWVIKLSGLEIKDEEHPDGDIEIMITGLRDGEKLYEELLIGDTDHETAHPKIRRSADWIGDREQVHNWYDEMVDGCRSDDVDAVRRTLALAVTGYAPADAPEPPLVETTVTTAQASTAGRSR
jgi:FlaA1/EpsC-like NDP-sugar epimerase